MTHGANWERTFSGRRTASFHSTATGAIASSRVPWEVVQAQGKKARKLGCIQPAFTQAWMENRPALRSAPSYKARRYAVHSSP